MRNLYTAVIDINNKDMYIVPQNTITPSIRKELSNTLPIKSSYVIADQRLELFSEAIKAVQDITNETVKKQALDVLNKLYIHLKDIKTTSYRFHNLSATQNEDGSCLIEWHFTKFHIGLSLEPCEKDSYYFFVSIDESTSRVETKTQRINNELNIIINDIIQFVKNNA